MISVEEPLISFENLFQKEYHLRDALKELDDIQNNIPVINVVGTNGKGSVSNYLTWGLEKKYSKVGMFTSPAFLYHNERIKINGTPISDEDLKKLLKESEPLIKKYKLSFFEIWTLIAIKYFINCEVGIAVIEAGIGGILDSTSVFENQKCVAVTSIGYDHTEILGEEIESIIKQKVGIVKNKKSIYTSIDNQQYINYFLKYSNGSKVFLCDEEKNVNGYQKYNIGLAKKILETFKINTNEISKVIAPLGRFTILKKEPLIIIDGSHNVDGITKMIETTKIYKKNFKILFGTSNKKNYKEMIKCLENNFSEIYFSEFDSFKSWTIPDEFKNREIKNWQEFIKNNKDDLIICGSLYFIPLVYKLF